MSDVIIRRADEADLPHIVAMLAADAQAGAREDLSQPLQPGYIAAFIIIDANPAQMLVVAEAGGCAVGTLQMNFVAGIARQGMRRAIIEAVRVTAEWRGQHLGARMVAWAIEEARRRGCGIVQLMSDTSYDDMPTSYEPLGFRTAQVGMMLEL